MTLYFSERNFLNETVQYLKKEFPRGEISSNYLEIKRANTIDAYLFLKYFDCAVAKEHNLYKAYITLPSDLNDRIPFWFTQSDGEIWVDPKSGLKGKNVHKEDVFTVKFNLFVDIDKIHSHVETRNHPAEKALIEEFTEIRHALIEGDEEPIEIIKGFYAGSGIKTPKSQTGTYLASILTTPH